MSASYSLDGSSYTSLPVEAMYDGSNAGKEESVIEFIADDLGRTRYDEGVIADLDFKFQCSATDRATFDTMIAATRVVAFYFRPGDGNTYYGWRDVNCYKPRIIDAVRVGSSYEPFCEFTISMKGIPA